MYSDCASVKCGAKALEVSDGLVRIFLMSRETNLNCMLPKQKCCCTPARGEKASELDTLGSGFASCSSLSKERMIRVQGGKFKIGYSGPEAWHADGVGPFSVTRATAIATV